MSGSSVEANRHGASPDADRDQRGLRIGVTGTIGQGETELSAFDGALYRAGCHNYNLLTLSSVIPPGSEVVVSPRFRAPDDEFGYKLHVVKAEARSATPGAVIGAAVGWLQWDDGRGVFVEHEVEAMGASCAEVKGALAGQLIASLRDLARVRGVDFAEERVGSLIVATRVERQPACALVLAVYQSEPWR